MFKTGSIIPSNASSPSPSLKEPLSQLILSELAQIYSLHTTSSH